MPTYEYKCLDCKRRFEVFQSMTDAALTVCESCGGRLKRLIGTGAGFLFKGSGFYITDYRSESYRQAQKKAAEGPAAAASSSASSSAGSNSSSAAPAAAGKSDAKGSSKP